MQSLFHKLVLVVCALALPAACHNEPDERSNDARLKILFVGDTSFGETYQVHRRLNVLRWRGYDYSLEKLKPILRDSDFVIANLETPVTTVRESPLEGKKAWVHKGDVEKTPRSLLAHNIRTVSLANNHTMDHGLQGLKETIEVLERNGMQSFGAALTQSDAEKAYLREFKVGASIFKLAVLGAFEYLKDYDEEFRFYANGAQGGVSVLSVEEIRRQIEELKNSIPGVYVVVFPHWGENYKWKSEAQTELAHRLVDAGADLIIGHGAHMMQEIESYKDRWIIYNLGNFMFNSQGRYQSLNVDPFSLVAQLSISETDGQVSKTLKLYPILTDNHVTGYQGRFLREDEFRKARDLLIAKSPNSLQSGARSKSGEDRIGRYIELAVR